MPLLHCPITPRKPFTRVLITYVMIQIFIAYLLVLVKIKHCAVDDIACHGYFNFLCCINMKVEFGIIKKGMLVTVWGQG